MTENEINSTNSVSGIVDAIIYQNEENGYTVFDIEDTNGDPVTVTGIVPYIAEGDKITVYGSWITHQVYGKQFRAETFEKSLPEDKNDMLRYLASGAVKGIGPKTAQRIIEKFGTDAFDVIENHPDWLTDINGITRIKAEKMSENFKAISGARSVLMFCRDFFTPQAAMKIYKKWGSYAIDRIRSNPYRLCEEFGGISFTRADQIAMSMGLDPESDERIVHAAIYVLRAESVRSGHTCLPVDEVVRCVSDLLFNSDTSQYDRIEECVLTYAERGMLSLDNYNGIKVIADRDISDAEKHIAKKLQKIARLCPRMGKKDAVLLIEKAESDANIKYANAQREALYSAIEDGVLVLTGGPGTGKTTIIKGLISIFSSLGQKVSLAAPTGRAAKRMSEATSYEAKTIHRLLEMDFSDEAGTSFMRDENNTLECDVLIVDEASMIDVNLMSAMLRAIKNGARLVLIGDADQLPSVGAGNVLGDIIKSGKYKTVCLTEIFRQSGESLIITNAHRINEGELPELTAKDKDFFFLARENEDNISKTVVDLVANRLPKSFGRDVSDKIQVITPSRKGQSGTETINHLLQNALNPPDKSKKELAFRDTVFREGDKIMQTKNNYTVEWETDGGRDGIGIFNGDIGTIKSIDPTDRTLEVEFDEKKTVLDSTMLDEIIHAYAITVHKSQGSEYPVVIFPLYSCAPMLLSRNLLYTAVTRASKMVILVGKRSILERMIENNAYSVRMTMLGKYIEREG